MELRDAYAWQPEDLATPGARFGGRFVDNIVLLVPTFLCAFLFAIALPRDDGAFGMVVGLLGGILGTIGIQYWSYSTTGQTLGKRAAGTRVLTSDGRQAGFFRGYLGRELIISVAGATRILGLINAVMVFAQSRRCGHDMILGTVVVSDFAVQQRGEVDADKVAEVFR